MFANEVAPKGLAAAAGNGKPQPPRSTATGRNASKGYTQRKLRSDDLPKAFGGPSKLTNATLPGRRPAAAGGDSRDLPGHGGGPRAAARPAAFLPSATS